MAVAVMVADTEAEARMAGDTAVEARMVAATAAVVRRHEAVAAGASTVARAASEAAEDLEAAASAAVDSAEAAAASAAERTPDSHAAQALAGREASPAAREVSRLQQTGGPARTAQRAARLAAWAEAGRAQVHPTARDLARRCRPVISAAARVRQAEHTALHAPTATGIRLRASADAQPQIRARPWVPREREWAARLLRAGEAWATAGRALRWARDHSEDLPAVR